MAQESQYTKLKRLGILGPEDPDALYASQMNREPASLGVIDPAVFKNFQDISDAAKKSIETAPAPKAPPKQKKGEGTTAENDTSNRSEAKQTSTEVHYADLPDPSDPTGKALIKNPNINQVMNFVKSRDDYKSMEKGIKDYQDMLSMEATRPQAVNLQPLMAMADLAMNNKTNQAGTYAQTFQDPSKHRDMLLKLTEKIQDDKKDLFRGATDAAKSLKAGQDQTFLGAAFNAANKIKADDPAKSVRGTGKPYDPNKDVQNLGKSRGAAAASIMDSLGVIDNELKAQGGIAGLEEVIKSGKIDIPGAGWKGALIPSGLMSTPASRIYQAAMDAALAKLQMRSGQQASDKEAAKYLAQFGLTPTSSAREMALGVLKLSRETQTHLAADEARFGTHKEVLDIYRKQPGAILSSDLNKFLVPQQKSAAPAASGGRSSGTRLTEEQFKALKPEERDAYLKKLRGE